MKKLAVAPILILCLTLVACSPIEQQARNTVAALQGALGAAQAKYQTTCTADPKQTACTTINRAIEGQNALATAVEAYCNWSQTTPPANTTATCVPVKGASAGLQTAINNSNLFIVELKGLIQ